MAETVKFIITVDTEADNQWRRPTGISTENLRYLPHFQNLCAEFGFIPTYLVTHEAALDSFAAEQLGAWQAAGAAEVGAHLHPWTTPPLAPGEDMTEHVYPSELSDDALRAKLTTLTRVITERFGRAPTSYRAGRWGLDSRQLALLAELGYVVDCSVTPKVSWRRQLGRRSGSGGPDFRSVPVAPYYPHSADVRQSGEKSAVLEVPMTIVYTSHFVTEHSRWAQRLLTAPDSRLKQIAVRLLLRPKWLRIFPNSTVADWSRIYRAAVRARLPALEFMIHSSELMPGGSPYAKDAAAVEKIYAQLTAMFHYFRQQGLPGVTLTGFAQNCCAL